MKKHVIILPAILGLLLSGCGHEEPPSQGSQAASNENGSADPSVTCSGMTTASSEESSSSVNLEEYFSSIIAEIESGSHEMMEKKPIIYFYPEEEMDLTVTFVNEEMLTTTYPKYDGGWNIHLKEDGTFTVPGSDREYYGLYYEANSDYECTFDEGFYVTSENAASFLEEKMDYMGFTNRETDEFIMYWLPILERNEQSLVYFEETLERNEESPLIFSTAPDTLIRTCIHIKKVDAPIEMVPQELTHVERNGFTVTEWGGLEH
ncbi:MAG: hypothetical protein K6F36_00555 [Bacilli bacterium]|nr:hypothetical protein [Bacilli bacterium]